MSDKNYPGDVLESGTSPARREDEAQALERAQREREDARDELRAEWRNTTRWALVAMSILTTICIAISAMGTFQVSNLNAELRDVRDRATVIEERMRYRGMSSQ